MKIIGKVFKKLPSNIDTDLILPGRYCHITEADELAKHTFEDYIPEFPALTRNGNILVADNNFGCGSSREVAPLALKTIGVKLIIARSFARIFFRNSVNLGLPLLEHPSAPDFINENDFIEADLEKGFFTVNTNTKFEFEPFPPFLMEIIKLGGLIEYGKRKLKQEIKNA
ncbi:MAG: 3-isopropylmalate dehydratase small subunit [Planctomycetota bacterium]